MLFGWNSKDLEGQKKDSLSKKPNESDLVAGTGLEPMTFGLWARRATNCSTPHYCDAKIIFVSLYAIKKWIKIKKCINQVL